MLRVAAALVALGVAFAAAYEGWAYATGQVALHPLLSGFVGGFAFAGALFAGLFAGLGEVEHASHEIDWNGRL